jgi:hypothetical protein
MAQSENSLLQQIQARFEELYRIHGELPLRSLADVIAHPNLIKEDFETYGFGVIQDALRMEPFERNQRNLIRELSLFIFNTEDPFKNADFVIDYERIRKKYPRLSELDQQLASLSSWWNSTTGFGNASFRFIYFQFLNENPRFQIGSEDIEFSHNPIHRWSLRLMEEHPELWTILKSFHRPEEHPMISYDSQKIRFFDMGRPLSKISKATKPLLTVPHRDVYMNDGVVINRVQAMLIHQDPNAISLGWILFSHDPIIQQLTSLLLTKKIEGFSTIKNERLIEIMKSYWRAPAGFVVWNQETIHYEGIPSSDRKLQAFEQTPVSLCRFSYRIAIGTHIPIRLTTESLYQLAYLCENGFCPEIYLKNKPNNRGTNVALNVVNRKTTQYMVPRAKTFAEIASLQNINYTPETINQTITALPPIIREFYGIY